LRPSASCGTIQGVPELNASVPPEHRDAAGILDGLLEGNGRFLVDEPRHRRDVASARRTAAGQAPSAVVFTCIDSRVIPEALFDCDFGQLLVVRTAGHVPDRAALGSLEFAAAELGVAVALVLGHERCGAVAAALHAAGEHADPPDDYLVERLWEPAKRALAETPAGEDPAPLALRLQVRRTAEELAALGGLQGVLVAGAVYDLDTGEVTVIDAK
jgi:carbonic anhydrase